jgi:hypothetical protein
MNYGSDTTPVNGGTFTINCDTQSRVFFELSSNVPTAAAPLLVNVVNLSRHIGKELDFIFNERSSVARSLTISTNIRFANLRPIQTSPSGISRLQCLIVQSNVALGTWTCNANAF